jgi:hypothetical protein
VTVQVTVVVPLGKVPGALFVTLITPQLSPVVGEPRFTIPDVQAVISGGQVMVGISLSVITTSCEQVAVFPFTSEAVQIIVVVPTGNVAGASFVTVAIPQLSVAVAIPIFTVLLEHKPGSVPAMIKPGQLIIGLSWSLIVIVKLHEVELPPISIAV